MSDSGLVEGNKTLVRRLIEHVWNNGDIALLGELVLPGFIRHHERNHDADLHGVDGFRTWVLAVRQALPDLRLTIEQMLGENDKVMLFLRGAGTYRGPLKGAGSTGEPLSFTATAIVRVSDGRIAEAWVIADTLAILQQLGQVRRLG